jgi:hypothetical protein
MRGKPVWLAGLIGLASALLMIARAELRPRSDVVRMAAVQLAPADGKTAPSSESPLWREAQLPCSWSPRGDGRDVWCRGEFVLARVPRELRSRERHS